MSGYRWPVAECLHENAVPECRQMMFGSETPVRVDPAWCPDCGHVFPEGPES